VVKCVPIQPSVAWFVASRCCATLWRPLHLPKSNGADAHKTPLMERLKNRFCLPSMPPSYLAAPQISNASISRVSLVISFFFSCLACSDSFALADGHRPECWALSFRLSVVAVTIHCDTSAFSPTRRSAAVLLLFPNIYVCACTRPS
jgi:hypothetical protein